MSVQFRLDEVAGFVRPAVEPHAEDRLPLRLPVRAALGVPHRAAPTAAAGRIAET
ncbi:hypothetical protein [Nocardia vermiculata]|uniref:Uncharacterized protein n=1 Tax=Nocardia vermiculata TaxID=257274 RepID=A0A846XUX0_9NOCA|nr:hypothetical protein [Nocardia vermiculata]NKY48898.1 hypothetical protein [Nocardia vermiculata]